MGYEDWISNLIVGKKIIIDGEYGFTIGVVEKITKTGRVNVNGVQFNSFGRQIGNGYHRSILREWSQEQEDKIRQQNRKAWIIKQLNATVWSSMEYGSLIAIYNAVQDSKRNEANEGS